MNRRELLQAGQSVLAAAGVDGEVATLTPVNPQAIVLLIPIPVPDELRVKIEAGWKIKFAGTRLSEVPVLMLAGGATIQVIDAPAEARGHDKN